MKDVEPESFHLQDENPSTASIEEDFVTPVVQRCVQTKSERKIKVTVPTPFSFETRKASKSSQRLEALRQPQMSLSTGFRAKPVPLSTLQPRLEKVLA